MKRILVSTCVSVALLNCQSVVANTAGLFFNVTTQGTTLSINTTIPNHSYPSAGIKINTPGYTLAGVGTECVDAGNGYCLFSVSNTQAKSISIAGSTGKMDITLCLNGKGPLSCQNYNNLSIDVTPPPKIAKFAYVTNYGGSIRVSLCSLDPTSGLFTSACQSAGGGSALTGSDPQGIVINNAGTMAYISNSNASEIFQCPINASDGTLGNCISTTITSPSGYRAYYGTLALNSANTMAYLVDSYNLSGGRVLACPIVNGLISSICVDTLATHIGDNPSGITLNRAGTVAYIGTYSGNPGVVVCNVNGSSFSQCVQKTGDGGSITFNEPSGVALNNAENIIYITDYTGEVYGCSTTPNNTPYFDSCFTAVNTTYPWSITLNAKNTQAYIGDYDGHVYICPILADGTFSTCTQEAQPSGGIDVALGY